MERVHNFNPGPAALPLSVLKEVREELLDYQDTGISILETSHRSPAFAAVLDSAQARLRSLLSVPESHAVLFLQGGASLQFAMVPMNLLADGTADYVDTGSWSTKAIKEAQRFGTVHLPFSGKDEGYTRLPGQDGLAFTNGARYVHLTSNNTIYGTQFQTFPAPEAPLVADMSSDILSRPVHVADFGLIYAGAQKNLGPAGVTVVLVDRELVKPAAGRAPSMLDYNVHMEKDSAFNTPPVFAIYVLDKVCAWVEAQGGLSALARTNDDKARALYRAIDGSDGFYRSPVDAGSRSKMNVVWRLPSEDLEARFLKEAGAAGLAGLKGHRSVGGLRASVYNAVGPEAVDALVSFMTEFARRNG